MGADDPILEQMKLPLGTAQPGVLRLGLVLNGTVSAGAWTAGALDALIEALDAWYAAKAAGAEVPRHDVRIEILGGASGGAVCAAIFARAALFGFGHGAVPGNPFWDVWGAGLDIMPMLDAEDLAVAEFPAASVLSATAIMAAAEAVAAWEGACPPPARPWLAPRLRVLMTQTNLRGVPYELPLRSRPGAPARATRYRAHADHVSFALGESGGLRGDELPLNPRSAMDWAQLARHARASGAFPIGFPPVRLSRPAAHYDWRGALLPGAPLPGGGRGPAEPHRLVPAWGPGDLAGASYIYDAVDGGALNNSPFALVHQRMTGLGGSLSRDPIWPDGAIIVLDPLAAAPGGPAGPGLAPGAGLADVMGQLVNALVAQARFSSSELALAANDTVASRHLFTAGRDGADAVRHWGETALATGGLGAFLGFLDASLRTHDFLLGRRNMQAWLSNHFVLPGNSALFNGGTPGAVSSPERPIIPLVASVAREPAPQWPAGAIELDRIMAGIEARVATAAGRQANGSFIVRVANWFLPRKAARAARARIEAALKDLQDRA